MASQKPRQRCLKSAPSRSTQPHAGRAQARRLAGLACEEPADVPQLKSLLAPYPADEMMFWPVSPRVGSVKNNDASLIEPVPS
jgi:hypothetical protein